MQPTQVLSTTSSFLAKQRCLTALLMDSAADAVTSAATLPWHRQPRRQRRPRDVTHQDKCKLSLAVTECNRQLGLTQMNHECEEIVGERDWRQSQLQSQSRLQSLLTCQFPLSFIRLSRILGPTPLFSLCSSESFSAYLTYWTMKLKSAALQTS